MAFRDAASYLADMSTSDRPVAFRIDRPAPDRAQAAARREAAVARIRAETGIDETMIDALVERSGAALVQRIGHVAVLYRQSTEKRHIVLPRA